MHQYNKTIDINKALLIKEDEATYGSRCSGELIKNPGRYRLIDLFSGAGGMSLGFSEVFGQPFRSVWANDFNKFCVDTYNNNFGPHCVHGDVVVIRKAILSLFARYVMTTYIVKKRLKNQKISYGLTK